MNSYKTGLVLLLALMTSGLSQAGNSGWMASTRNWVTTKCGAVKDAVSGYFNPSYTQQVGQLIKDHPYALAGATGAFAGYVVYPAAKRIAKNLAQDFTKAKKSTQLVIVLGGLLAAYGIKSSGISLGSFPSVNPYVAATGIAGLLVGDHFKVQMENRRHQG